MSAPPGGKLNEKLRGVVSRNSGENIHQKGKEMQSTIKTNKNKIFLAFQRRKDVRKKMKW